MTAVNHIINVGDPIPDDVVKFYDKHRDVWTRTGPDEWDTPDTKRFGADYILNHWAPLVVLAVSA